MVNPKELGAASTIFMAGNDAAAKASVTELLQSFGHSDVIDLGDISGSRGTEMLLPVWLRLMGTLGTANFNFSIVR
jgi:predicted dinucleotide-binding enzyme